MTRTRLYLVCSGLGHVRRGFETFTQQCYDALRTDPSLDVTLFKGGGNATASERRVWNLPRESTAARQLGRLVRRDGYFVEQMTFVPSVLARIAVRPPDVVYASEHHTGKLLWHWRRLTGQRFKLLLCNGGPYAPPFPYWDHVQQVTPYQYDAATAAGETADRQSLLPHAIPIAPRAPSTGDAARTAHRHALGIPAGRPVLLSVAAINTRFKRADYVVREVARLPAPRPYLILLGQQEPDTPAVRALAEQLLGPDGFRIATVPAEQVASYYAAADAFVLGSLSEGFGLVFLEAMASGLPCLAHDYPVSRFVLREYGHYADFRLDGGLAALVADVLGRGDDAGARDARHRAAYERFSWDRLTVRYVDLVHRCAHPERYALSA